MNAIYWNEDYWKRHLEQQERMDVFEDLWLQKHQTFVDSLPKGTVLDLGCGIGQYTDYWLEKGFRVVSTDLSSRALEELKRRTLQACTQEMDMSRPFPFENERFDVVFANLSIHYFDAATTHRLAGEIHRVLRTEGVFIGSVNSSYAYQFIKDKAETLEENFYAVGPRQIRLFDRVQFDQFFSAFRCLSLEETQTIRFHNDKNQWEFIFQK